MTNGTTAIIARCWWGGRYEIHWWTEKYDGEEATLFGTLHDFVAKGHETEILKVIHRLPSEDYPEFASRVVDKLRLYEVQADAEG